MSNNLIKILGIESSCDDSAVAIIDSDKKILSNIIISQDKEHAAFQGIVPELAARAHINNIETALISALNTAKINIQDIDAVATTCGPGLVGGLIVGSTFGKSLASILKKPFIAINHLEGHALSIMLTHDIEYPYLLLLVSGGHCQFISVHNIGKYKILGGSLDDAVGEAFDKVARMLGLGFPGGPKIEHRAQFGNSRKYKLPIPLSNRANCDMSFSGLKTAVMLLIQKFETLTDENINDIAASFQYTIGCILSKKLIYAIAMYEQLEDHNFKKFVMSGGVAANQYLKHILECTIKKFNYKLFAPPPRLCTDNAAMIAYAGLERLKLGLSNKLDFGVIPTWSLKQINDYYLHYI